MRIYTLIFFISIMQFLPAQVGINTQNAYTGSVLHIDPKGNTSGTTNSSDDVLIDASGNIGIGTLLPKAKLDIVKAGTNSPLRIVDGGQGTNKVLKSDTQGNASWMDMPSTSAANYSITGSVLTFNAGTVYLVKAIPISANGFYQIVIRWWGRTWGVNGTGVTAAVFYLASSTGSGNAWTADEPNVKDSAESYVSTNATTDKNSYPFCFALPLSSQAAVETYLKVYIKVGVGGPWKTGEIDAWNANWNPSISVYRI
ncbi:hypothetical protein CLV62_101163 [Dysgonomonas alginatilytica]|uniref:Uncharacterized protein n=1 Tax=Dysgonomonas alginatilytica TaxID=1605892 RepID=A0A2V3PT39_9BACT|nr:hypothetical protein [Dysgonomonas alginatilytica]PXV68897.1 hypothetical protein CLV62_101163 [Dysgonomonas alginatilytica]